MFLYQISRLVKTSVTRERNLSSENNSFSNSKSITNKMINIGYDYY